MNMDDKNLREIASQFAFSAEPVMFALCENGHINGTYFVTCADGRRYVMQQINTSIFVKPDEVMENILGVTSFLKKKIAAAGGDPERETLTVVWTKDGACAYVAPDGGYWRAYLCIEGRRRTNRRTRRCLPRPHGRSAISSGSWPIIRRRRCMRQFRIFTIP